LLSASLYFINPFRSLGYKYSLLRFTFTLLQHIQGSSTVIQIEAITVVTGSRVLLRITAITSIIKCLNPVVILIC